MKTANATINQEIARNIMEQIGNGTFYMMGAYQFVASDNGLTFKFKGSRKTNCMKITLNGSDLYDVTFYKIKRFDFVEVAEYDNVFFDQLKDIIESTTGLYTTL